MPKVSSEQKYSTFIKGFVTEASPLTYPENASLDEDNFILKRNGSRERRLGLDYEDGHSLVDTGFDTLTLAGTKYSFHKWENPSGITDISIGVVRVYNKLWFFNLLKDNISNNLLNGGVPLTVEGLSNASLDTAVINNFLVLVSSDLRTPVVLAYDRVSDLIIKSEIPIQVRDLWGVNDGLNVDERPSTLSKLHEYNLNNQGWGDKIQTICSSGAPSGGHKTARRFNLSPEVSEDTEYTQPAKYEENAATTYTVNPAIECTKTTLGVYPSNADIWTLGKTSDTSVASLFEKYDPNILAKNSLDNVVAAKGRFIIDAFNRGSSRNALVGFSTLPLDVEYGAITTVVSFSGRVFYSGVWSNSYDTDSKSPNYSNYIFFSQTATAGDKLGLCYQEADPTSPNISDIIDTDGGTIQIPEATKIVKLIATRSSLLVFAENGVWEVFGDTQGFVATSYQTQKISSNGCSSPNSIVEANGSVVAWTKMGIYAYTVEPTSGRYAGQNISLTTIQEFYNGLSEISKNNAKGFYDEKENVIRWLFNDTEEYAGNVYCNRYNRELLLDLTLQSFYLQSSSSASVPFIADYVDIPNYSVNTNTEAVYSLAGGVVTTIANGDILIENTVTAGRVTQFAVLTMVGSSFTFSKYSNRSFTDWEKYYGIGSGINYTSYLLTGYEVFGDFLRHKQVPYIWIYLLKTEDGFTTSGSNLIADNQSSCLVQAQWNWCNSAAAGKWGTPFQAYRFKRNYIPSGEFDPFDNGDLVVVSKNKLRGSGRSLSLLIQSEAGKDMKLLGWAVLVEGGKKP